MKGDAHYLDLLQECIRLKAELIGKDKKLAQYEEMERRIRGIQEGSIWKPGATYKENYEYILATLNKAHDHEDKDGN